MAIFYPQFSIEPFWRTKIGTFGPFWGSKMTVWGVKNGTFRPFFEFKSAFFDQSKIVTKLGMFEEVTKSPIFPAVNRGLCLRNRFSAQNNISLLGSMTVFCKIQEFASRTFFQSGPPIEWWGVPPPQWRGPIGSIGSIWAKKIAILDPFLRPKRLLWPFFQKNPVFPPQIWVQLVQLGQFGLKNRPFFQKNPVFPPQIWVQLAQCNAIGTQKSPDSIKT